MTPLTLIADGRLSPRTVEALRRHGILNERVEEDDAMLSEATIAQLKTIPGVGAKSIKIITDAKRRVAKDQIAQAATHQPIHEHTFPGDVDHAEARADIEAGNRVLNRNAPGDSIEDPEVEQITREPRTEERVVVYQNGEAVAIHEPPEHKLGTRAAVTFLQERHMEWLEETAKLHNDTVDRIIEQCIRRVYSEDAYKAGANTVKREDFEI